MFKNIFKKETNSEVIVAEIEKVVKTYPKEVLEIHHEFEIASDKLLEQAYSIINSQPKVNESKIERLMKFGFSQVKEVEEGIKIIEKTSLSKEQIDLIAYYKREYPFNKFITESQVKEICHKYNLVCGDVSRFTGFVPEKNLQEMISFKIKEIDKCEYQVFGPNGEFNINKQEITENVIKYLESNINTYVEYSSGRINVIGGEQKYGQYAKVTKKTNNLKICAPVKDMDIKGLELVEGYKLEKKHIPDPVVLQPVKFGFLILTAWGDEASDPLVMNETMN